MTVRKGATAAGVIVDLFAGPGGWSEGLRMLGRTEVGVELDEHACATARAAGHRRIQDDVAQLSPVAFTSLVHGWDGCTVEGLIGSPPCPTFSAAGKGAGRRDIDHVIACAMELAVGNDTRAEHRERCEDERSMLTIEPLRWALALRPEWIALEQVPPVLEIWSLFAQLLTEHGYSCWTGVLEAERYGVPQTRERAILMAKRGEHVVHPPHATHQRYVPGEPQRHDVTFDGEILPWVSMAEALGWGMTERPSVTVMAKPSESGGHRGLGAGTGSQEAIDRERNRGAWQSVSVVTGQQSRVRRDPAVPQVPFERSIALPAPTVTGTTDRWHYDRRQTGGDGTPVGPRAVDEPAPTMTAAGLAKGRDVWVKEAAKRPAPTVTAGGTDSGGVEVFGRGTLRAELDAKRVRVTVEEAAVLQSFRPDYPWQGTRSQQFTQVGNAVPPLLARAVLDELADAVELERAA